MDFEEYKNSMNKLSRLYFHLILALLMTIYLYASNDIALFLLIPTFFIIRSALIVFKGTNNGNMFIFVFSILPLGIFVIAACTMYKIRKIFTDKNIDFNLAGPSSESLKKHLEDIEKVASKKTDKDCILLA